MMAGARRCWRSSILSGWLQHYYERATGRQPGPGASRQQHHQAGGGAGGGGGGWRWQEEYKPRSM